MMETGTYLPGQVLQFYALGKRWASDLEFFRIETVFFHHLIDEFLVGLTAPENHGRLAEIAHRLSELEHDEKELAGRLDRHLKQIALISEGIISGDTEELAEMHLVLEHLVDDLVATYREVKKRLFSLVAEIRRMESTHH